jgi:hypothetical protein
MMVVDNVESAFLLLASCFLLLNKRGEKIQGKERKTM